MTYRGAFMAGAKVGVPPVPDPDNRHGKKTFPDTNWSSPPATVAEVGESFDQKVSPPMTGRGIVLDLGHRFGHAGTALTARAQARFIGPESQGVAQDASALAHGDTAAAAFPAHSYAPIAKPFAGESYDVDQAEGIAGVPKGARAIVKNYSQHSDGAGGDFAPTGYRLGVARRWAGADYSTPLLGAMYSTNALRGVLPQTVAVPVDQPSTGEIRNSGLSSQQRQLLRTFNLPALFRSPPSASDQMMAAQPDSPVNGPVI